MKALAMATGWSCHATDRSTLPKVHMAKFQGPSLLGFIQPGREDVPSFPTQPEPLIQVQHSVRPLPTSSESVALPVFVPLNDVCRRPKNSSESTSYLALISTNPRSGPYHRFQVPHLQDCESN